MSVVIQDVLSALLRLIVLHAFQGTSTKHRILLAQVAKLSARDVCLVISQSAGNVTFQTDIF